LKTIRVPVRFLTGVSNYCSNSIILLGIANSKVTKYAVTGPMQGLEIGNLTYTFFFKKKKKEKRKETSR